MRGGGGRAGLTIYATPASAGQCRMLCVVVHPPSCVKYCDPTVYCC